MWYISGRLNSAGTYTESYVIGRISATGEVTEFPVGGDPLDSITKGVDGQMWFVSFDDKIGKISDVGNITEYPLVGQNVAARGIAEGPNGFMWATTANADQIVRIGSGGAMNRFDVPDDDGKRGPFTITAGSDGNMWFTQFEGGRIAKIGTFGSAAPDPEDADGDGLRVEEEMAQQTSDNNKDSDGDGLDDFVESGYNPSRDELFCGSVCEFPTPNKKDIYIEVDWMNKPASWFTPGYSMRPNDAQVTSLKAAFDRKNSSLHIDRGQLGGGNEVPYNATIKFLPQSGPIDFYDYKRGGDGIPASFDARRYKVYHYALMGQRYAEAINSSGVSYPGDDDLFVSYGLIKDYPRAPLDRSIAGTFIHELGHNLCLTHTSQGYPGQPASCRFAGIDNSSSNYLLYTSSMNYTKQQYMVDYSNGTYGATNDHNDWAALQLDDFTLSGSGDMLHQSLNARSFVAPQEDRRPIYGPSVR